MSDCEADEVIKEKVTDLMLVPLIHSTLRYVYKGENRGDEKAVAKHTEFAQAVLPLIHRTSPSTAATIYNSMKTIANSIVPADMKVASKSVYEDLGVTCEQASESLTDNGDYYEGMEPCKIKCTDKPQGEF